MFENRRTGWHAPIDHAVQLFRQAIRSRQIQQYKAQIRHHYSLPINYADPRATIHTVKLAIVNRHMEIEYIVKEVGLLMGEFSFCRAIAEGRLLESLLVAAAERGQGVGAWVELVAASLDGWPDLWLEFYRQSVGILWAIILQYPVDSSLCSQVAHILLCCQSAHSLEITPPDQQLVALLSRPHCPSLLALVAELLTPAVQLLLHQRNLLLNQGHLLQNEHSCNYYLYLLSKVSVVDREILVKVEERMRHGHADVGLSLRILYQQMYYGEEQLREAARVDAGLQAVVDSILGDD